MSLSAKSKVELQSSLKKSPAVPRKGITISPRHNNAIMDLLERSNWHVVFEKYVYPQLSAGDFVVAWYAFTKRNEPRNFAHLFRAETKKGMAQAVQDAADKGIKVLLYDMKPMIGLNSPNMLRLPFDEPETFYGAGHIFDAAPALNFEYPQAAELLTTYQEQGEYIGLEPWPINQHHSWSQNFPHLINSDEFLAHSNPWTTNWLPREQMLEEVICCHHNPFPKANSQRASILKGFREHVKLCSTWKFIPAFECDLPLNHKISWEEIFTVPHNAPNAPGVRA